MARAALNLSIADVSKETGLHRNTLQNVERGEGSQTTLTLLRLFYGEKGVVFTASGVDFKEDEE